MLVDETGRGELLLGPEEPHDGVMITHTGLEDDGSASWQLPVSSGEAPRRVSADVW